MFQKRDHTDKIRKSNFPNIKGNSEGAVIRKGFLICEEMRKFFVEEASVKNDF
jgi:hypothetical protein